MILYSNAKINIGLNVIEKRKDNFHNINSIFYPVFEMFDIIEIKKSKNFEFTTSGIKIECKIKENLCFKVFSYFKKKYKIQNIKIHLHKNIPIGSGLGGGSSNAAFTIIAINDLFELKLNNKELALIAAKIGSDCPFFIYNKPKYVSGIGDILDDVHMDLFNYKIKIYTPKIKISTKHAFGKILANKNNEGIILKHISKPIDVWKNYISNDFEDLHINTNNEIIQLKQKAYERGAIFSSMTGTGSAVYAIFKNN